MSTSEKSLEYNIEPVQTHIIEKLLDENASTSITSKISGVPETTIQKYAENNDIQTGDKNTEHTEQLYQTIGLENTELEPSQIGGILHTYLKEWESPQQINEYLGTLKYTQTHPREILQKLGIQTRDKTILEPEQIQDEAEITGEYIIESELNLEHYINSVMNAGASTPNHIKNAVKELTGQEIKGSEIKEHVETSKTGNQSNIFMTEDSNIQQIVHTTHPEFQEIVRRSIF